MAEITIIGAGVAGLCVAAELAARGLRPRVIDRYAEAGPHLCSWWAGGMLAPSCEGEHAPEPVVRLGREAAAWWREHTDTVVDAGTLVVALARDRRELDHLARRTEGHELLDARAVAELEPALAERVDGALFYRGESHLDPRRALAALRERLAARGIAVEERAMTAHEPGQVIDCRGLAARDALTDLRGVKGEMVVVQSRELAFARPVRLLHPRHSMYLVPRGDGIFMLGGTQIESGERGRVTARSLVALLSGAYALHPAFGEAALVETGADARPAFADNLPRLRLKDGVLHVNGLFRHGFLMAPVLARMAADWLTTGTRSELMDED